MTSDHPPNLCATLLKPLIWQSPYFFLRTMDLKKNPRTLCIVIFSNLPITSFVMSYNIPCFIIYFTLNGTTVYKRSIMLYWRRLQTIYWDHKLKKKTLIEVADQVRSRRLFSQAFIQSDFFVIRNIAPWWLSCYLQISDPKVMSIFYMLSITMTMLCV